LASENAISSVLHHWRPEVILHAAARIPGGKDEDAFTFFEDNVRATLNVLHHAQRAGVKHVVYSSTMSVYGKPTYLPVDEQHPLEPTGAYGISKLEGELYGKLYSNSSSLSVTVLRYSGIYGQGQKSGAVPTFIARCLGNAPVLLHAGGRPSSDYVWVEDVVQANLQAIQITTPLAFEVFNIGSGVELSVGALAEMIRRLCHSRSEIHLVDEASPRDFRFFYDISKARAILGFSPTDPEMALQRCIQQWRMKEW
jgi:UDP-glucose 4-epimerase